VVTNVAVAVAEVKTEAAIKVKVKDTTINSQTQISNAIHSSSNNMEIINRWATNQVK